MSLFSIAERFTALDHSALVLNTERCLHSQDRFSGCKACFDICPVNAITPGKPPSLNPEKCGKCMACLMVCPVGAYTADGSVASLLNAVKHLEGSTIELLCERNPHAALGISKTSTGIRIKGCLAGLGSGAYFVLAAFGHAHILARMDACSGCEWETLPGRVEAQVRQAKQVLEVWGREGNLASISLLDSPVERPLWEGTNPPLSRRDLFMTAFRQGRETLARAVDDLGTVADRLPGRDRLRLLNAVKHMSASQPGSTSNLKDMDFAWISVSEVCTACGVCARICPTSALQFEKNAAETAYKLNFLARNCVGCEMCMHVCAPSSMSLDPTPTFTQIFNQENVTIHEGGLMKCKKCGALTAAQPGVDLCLLCEYRRTHPFGSMLPPGIKNIRPPAALEKPE
jgi:ferredoxin